MVSIGIKNNFESEIKNNVESFVIIPMISPLTRLWRLN